MEVKNFKTLLVTSLLPIIYGFIAISIMRTLTDYSAQSKTGRFLFNKSSIRGQKVGLLSSFLHTLYIFLLNVCIS